MPGMLSGTAMGIGADRLLEIKRLEMACGNVPLAVKSSLLACSPRVSIAFMCFAVMPFMVWLTVSGERPHLFMGMTALGVLGLLLLLQRHLYRMILAIFSASRQNVELLSNVKESELRMSCFFENEPGLFFTATLHSDGKVTLPFTSTGAGEMLGLEDEALTGNVKSLTRIVYSEDIARFVETGNDAQRNLKPFRQEFRISHAKKGERWIELRCVPQNGPDGSTNWHGFMHDITERKRVEEKRITREYESRSLIENSPDNISRYNRDCLCIFANPAFGSMVEGGVGALLGKKPSEYPGGVNAAAYEERIAAVLETGNSAEFELRWPCRDGREICSHVRLIAERDSSGDVSTVLAVGRDITDIRQKIHQMAFYDPLTSLSNRYSFNERLKDIQQNASKREGQAVMMLLDLDRFKAINDTMGHPVGDQLLREAAIRLNGCVRDGDMVARLGGDEFAILLPEMPSDTDLGRFAEQILETFRRPFTLDGKEVFVSASIGIAVYPDDGSNADDLVKHADSAMYLAKRSGRNDYRFYSKELTVQASERFAVETRLRGAVERKELELYFQPKINLADGALIGSEALVRWNHPKLGLVPPDQFIGIAEDSGLIVEIGEWVLREACHIAREWNAPDMPLHRVAINLSARQFQSGDLAKTVNRILEETDCLPEWIELEITESMLLDEQGGVLETLNQLQTLGIAIAIDDFGTGYSSLSYLARYPINTLKIDRIFVTDITIDPHRAELVKAIIAIAHNLELSVVAEGVDTKEQAANLRQMGCQIAQGYLYSKPLPKATFQPLLTSFGKASNLGNTGKWMKHLSLMSH